MSGVRGLFAGVRTVGVAGVDVVDVQLVLPKSDGLASTLGGTPP